MNALRSPTAPGLLFSRAAELRPAPVSPLAAQGRLPLAFMGLGLGWLAVSGGLLAVRSDLLTLPHTAPAVLALVHAWVLGFFVTIAMGAVYQLAPVALGTALTHERRAWCHFGLHAAGVPGMVIGFWHWQIALLGVSGCVVGLGVALFVANTASTIQRSGKRDAVAWSLALASGWLSLTVLAGLLIVANRAWNFWAADPLALLRAHAHLGLIGFFVTLFQGVTFRLVPMFTLGDVPDWRPVRVGLACSQLGLVGLAPALAFHHGYVAAACGGLLFIGLTASAWALKRALATRKKRRLDAGLRGFLRGLIAIAGAAVGGILLVWPRFSGGSAPGGFSASVYGALILLGGFLPAFAGMLGKIVPFLTWMRAYGPKVGRQPTPAASALISSRLEKTTFVTHGIALVPLIVGAWRLDPRLLELGAWLLAAGIGLFLANMVLVLRHLWRPVDLRHARPSSVKGSS